MKIALLFLFLATALHADPATPRATVWVAHPEAAKKFFPPPKYRMLDAADEQKQMDETGYMMPQQRDALFHKLNLEDSLKNLDEMDKDMLVMGAREEELSSLRKHYPMLSEAQLRALQKEVKDLARK